MNLTSNQPSRKTLVTGAGTKRAGAEGRSEVRLNFVIWLDVKPLALETDLEEGRYILNVLLGFETDVELRPEEPLAPYVRAAKAASKRAAKRPRERAQKERLSNVRAASR